MDLVNMQEEINSLKTLIMNDTPSAYCIHCFAYQLQLTLVVVAKKYYEAEQFFDILTNVLNIIEGSFKRSEMLRDDQAEKLEELLVLDEVHTGSVLALTYDLNMALQKKDQDIVSAIKLVGFAERQLQDTRDSRWNSLIEDVSLFCVKHGIVISERDMNYVRGKSKLNTDLLLSMASLSPDNPFANYDKYKIMKLSAHYPNEFTDSMLEDLSFELDIYIDYMREADNEFSNLKKLGDLSEILVKINLHMTWRLAYLLVKLSLILHVATVMVERAFSSMKYVKNDLRSRFGDEFFNDCLVCYIEDEVFESVPNDAVIDRFQNMTSRRVQL
ncbi:uncharacterized protein LOC142167982 [Nicotiana tabacum]|uniref:Uncharacterized protein LOC142167982 n=1 Tax=Nicotiana tabacum TaxID=4097 RepID=A0AC58SIC7_TOBAC